MRVEYRDHNIDYNESTNTWNSEEKTGCSSLAEAKKAIDKALKKQVDQTKVYYGQDGGTATITSITEEGEAWVAIETAGGGGYRQKAAPYQLYEFSEQNRLKLEEIKALREDLDKISTKREQAGRELVRVDIKKLLAGAKEKEGDA